MSDNFLIVIPNDPLASLPKERVDEVVKLLAELRPDAEIELHMSDMPEFFFCAENFEATYCPFCQSDITDWWWQELHVWTDRADQRDLTTTTPCCRRATSLNDLDFDWPQGFACVGFRLLNPGVDLEPEKLRQVEAALGMPARIIWRRI